MKRYAMLTAVAASLLGAVFLANASAGPGPPMGFGFSFNPSHERPTAGRLFRAIVVTNRDPARVKMRSVRCDAQVGNERLRGRQHRYFAPPYKTPADIACSWRIPVGAAGKTLRLWRYGFGRRVGVFDSAGFVAGSKTFSWRVKP